ncbi:hypothetical protein ORJ04_22230 [Rheinheimera baltica]|uniref:DUF7684 domain-containing protein n=1 Tax=Rheinheimera baltica TaxID=67576 RepID=A0ABT9I5I1_9GAMM|nr:hypothetical protein [Rheinheimera baltica]MDP5138669.1 hypothetical protein [Rheinheimera baltica]
MSNYKFVLISESGYSKKHDKLLLNLLEQGYELFCAVGKDCEVWEEIMDELSVGDGSNSRYITTTSHPEESIEDVIEFAKLFSINKESDVDVVRI